MASDKPPGKRVWDTLSRHMRRKAHGADPPSETAQPPPAAPPVPPPEPRPEPPPEPAPPPAATPVRLPSAQEDDQGGAAAPLPAWKKSGFKLTEEQAAKARDPKVQMARLMDYAREKPLRATLILLTVVSIVVGDAIILARSLGLDDYLMISLDLGEKPFDRFALWERRGSGLSYLAGPPGKEKEVTDPREAAAVDGTLKLPDKPLETPKLAGGLAGILTPEELKGSFRGAAVGGIDGAVTTGQSGSAAVSKAFVKTAADDFKPYAPADASHDAPMPAGVFFGRAGEALENFASLSNTASAASEYRDPDFSAVQEVPKGLKGDDLVMAMIGEDLQKELKAYAKGGKWKMRKMEKGEKTVRHEMEGMTLTGNDAVIQLLQTKRSTDLGLRCSTCQTERRIHNTRAPFFGEEH